MIDKVQKLFNSQTAVMIIFTVMATSLAFNTFNVIQRNYELQKKLDNLEDEVALIDVQNQNLKYNIEYYKTDNYLEIEAKRRFNLAGKGEGVIFLPKDGDPVFEESDSLIEQSQGIDSVKSNFEKWMLFLSGSSS